MSDERNENGTAYGLRKAPVLSEDSVDETRVIRLGGELDLYNAPQVRDALQRASADGAQMVVVDLSEVEFIDSTGLGILIEARTKLANRSAFLLAGPGLETRRALEISGLDKHFSVHETVEDALSQSA